MSIIEVVVDGGDVLECVILKSVPNILPPSCMLTEWTKHYINYFEA